MINQLLFKSADFRFFSIVKFLCVCENDWTDSLKLAELFKPCSKHSEQEDPDRLQLHKEIDQLKSPFIFQCKFEIYHNFVNLLSHLLSSSHPSRTLASSSNLPTSHRGTSCIQKKFTALSFPHKLLADSSYVAKVCSSFLSSQVPHAQKQYHCIDSIIICFAA